MGNEPPRFGVEEEFLVVDPVTRVVVPDAAIVIARAEATLGKRVGGEITKLQVEARTDPCLTVEQLYAQLAEGRRVLDEAARANGLRVVATGTPVLAEPGPPPMTEGPRQDRGLETFRGLHDELAICAVHVHVELPETEQALMVSNHLRPHLPTLIALAANSPYWNRRDTGYASWRMMIWPRWPVAGPPPYFTSVEHHAALVDTLHEAGALVDSGTIFWDIRPSAHQPTLEIRVADMPMTAEESALIAVLVRALVIHVLPAVEAGDPGPVIPAELLRLAYWRAARDGLGGSGVDPLTGRLVRTVDLVEWLLQAIRPVLEQHGDLERVVGWLRTLVEQGDGATRQRRAAERTGGLTGVVDELIAQTAGRAPAGHASAGLTSEESTAR